jgi:hypothetical protein
MYPLPEDVHFTPGWQRGPTAHIALTTLRRAYAKRVPVR